MIRCSAMTAAPSPAPPPPFSAAAICSWPAAKNCWNAIPSKKGAAMGALFQSKLGPLGGDGFALLRVAQHIAAAPHGFDVIVAVGGGRQLLAQLADEDVDDLELG